MADRLVVVVPSRGRPQAAAELIRAFDETCALEGTSLAIVLDEDDPVKDDYRDAINEAFDSAGRLGVVSSMESAAPSTMVKALNLKASELAAPAADERWGEFFGPLFAIGFMGDDHRPRTVGWDKEYLDALRELGTGIVYGNDLLQAANLPTQCAMTADIIRELGYMAPPTLRHMYVDNFWLDLGREADCLFYLPDVVVEHMHPVAGKAEWTEGHKRVNDQKVYDADAAAYAEYHRFGQFAADVTKVRALRAAA